MTSLNNTLEISYEDALDQVTAPGGDFAVVEEEINGVRYLVFEKFAPFSLPRLFQYGVENYADEIFIVYEDRRWTFAETYQQAANLAQILLNKFSLQRGDRVAIAMRNYPEWLFSFMAITSIGAVAVPINAWWTTKELDYVLEDSGALLVVADQERVQRLKGILSKKELLQIIAVRYQGVQSDQLCHYQELMEAKEDQEMPQIPIHPDDDAAIMYTSGSTGHPKGVVSTHRGMISPLPSWLVSTLAMAVQDGVDIENPRAPPFPPARLVTSPLFHTQGLQTQFLGSYFSGEKAVLMYKWDAEKALELIEKERITTFVGVPTMSWELLRSQNLGKYDLSSLVTINAGGAARPPGHAKLFKKKLPESVPSMGWGLTETNSLGANNTGEMYLQKPASIGRPLPLTKIKVVDQNNQEVPVSEHGEILIKTTANARAYWNQPDATSEVFQKGWFRTGDIGYFDEDGFLYIVDRAKDIVIRGGENISCLEVEAAIYEHPDVIEASVFGVPDERFGELVYAVVMLKRTNSLEEKTMKAFLQDHIARYKIPEFYEFRTESLPRNKGHKINKKQLRKEAIEKSNF